MKLESLVIADQLCRGEYVPNSCTQNKRARQLIFGSEEEKGKFIFLFRLSEPIIQMY